MSTHSILYLTIKKFIFVAVEINDDREGDFLKHAEELIETILLKLPQSKDLVTGSELQRKLLVSIEMK